MSDLWDTPEFWARYEADEMLREMTDIEGGVLAASFERSGPDCDGEPEVGAAIVAECGIGQPAFASGRSRRPREAGCATPIAGQGVEPIDYDIPWESSGIGRHVRHPLPFSSPLVASIAIKAISHHA